ncbi:hypothetical protein ACLOJK_039865 [Asimina triloba]
MERNTKNNGPALRRAYAGRATEDKTRAAGGEENLRFLFFARSLSLSLRRRIKKKKKGREAEIRAVGILDNLLSRCLRWEDDVKNPIPFGDHEWMLQIDRIVRFVLVRFELVGCAEGIAKEMDVLQAEPQPPRFQRTDLWMPVYSWLESLDKTEIVKPNEIIDWLSENPGIREQLYSKHPRHQVMHYIQRCHFKMLRRREKQRKENGNKTYFADIIPCYTNAIQSFGRMQGIPVPATRSQVTANDGAPTPAVPLRLGWGITSHVVVFEGVGGLILLQGVVTSPTLVPLSCYSEKVTEELLGVCNRCLTDLLNQLTSVLSSYKQANHSKESSSPPLLKNGFGENGNHHLSNTGAEEGNVRAMSGGMSCSQDLELASPIDLKSGIKRKRIEVEVIPGASYCEAVAGTQHP